jgi:deazaflavin-dependent oxidoreductase (nitroreductase family)
MGDAMTVQLCLPGQAAAPEGPVDLSGMFLMHRAFRRDLDRFRAAVPATPYGDRATWRRLARRWTFLGDVLHKHHRGEDAGLWPLLRSRAPDARDVLDGMEAEHERIDPLLATCAAGFARMAASGNAAVRDDLTAHVAALHDLLSAHLAHEEADALALVQTHLTPTDWERLDREFFAAEYGSRDLVPVLGWVLDGLADDAAERVPGLTPALLRIGGVCARRFARREVRTFRFVPGVGPTGLTRRDRALVAVSRGVAAVHTGLHRRSGGRLVRRFRGGDVLLLTVAGRRSGRSFTTPLLHIRDGEDYVVAASNGGIDREPQWWRNLLAHPDAVVEVGGRSVPVVASEVDGPERAALWDRLVATLADYEGYQAEVRRRIAVVRLSPSRWPSSSPRLRSRA